MNIKLTILGSNILMIAFLLAIYGLLTGDLGLVGLAVSNSVIGGVILVYSLETSEPSIRALREYIKLLVNTSTVILEDMDLLNNTICVSSSDGDALITITKKQCTPSFNPGLGFTTGSPYLSIPIEASSDILPLSDIRSEIVEDSMNTILVDKLGLCKNIKVEQFGEMFIVYITGINELLVDYTRYPLNPVILLTLSTMARLLKAHRLQLVEKQETLGLLKLVIRVEK